ncbi:MBL fold metallo-hydrolase [Micromonospora sp. MS34]|uniref:MBL fold metallo-hydrolase n=1 Tax=Micromonospora sp. MS34 TaxID=3385971 RepID=UPI0039A1AAD6
MTTSTAEQTTYAADLIDFTAGAPVAGSLDVAWIHGVPSKRSAPEAPIQVHWYDEHTAILRQSKAVNYEAPFLYLLFGNGRALLLDTGATANPQLFPLRATVDGLIESWLAAHPRDGYELIVAHSHSHHDHVAADPQFADRPATTVVARELDAMQSFFGFDERWPVQTVTLDLGGRVLRVLGSPGHHAASITLYDPWTGILLSGDTVLPGRIYAFDFAAFRATIDRLVDFATEHPVTHVLGCHVEMKRRPGRLYPIGTEYQPDERPLPMTVTQLIAVRDAAEAVAGRPGVHRFDDFVIYQSPRKRHMIGLLARGLTHKALVAITRR